MDAIFVGILLREFARDFGIEFESSRHHEIFEISSRAVKKTIGSHLKAPAKRLQHANVTYRNIVGCNMLRAFGHRFAMCCDMLGVVGSNLKMVKIAPTRPKMSQHVATRWPNARNMLHPTMLPYVVLTCCDRLAGALQLTIPPTFI